MGQAKALMMEIEETDFEPVDIAFHCPNCDGECEGTTELPIVYEGGDSKYLPITITCFHCDESVSGWVDTDWDECQIVLDHDPDREINTEPARGSNDRYDYEQLDYFDWLAEQERAHRPVFKAFSKTIDDIEELATQVGIDDRSQMLARMLVSQSITALEVFLTDTLIRTVANSPDAQGRLLRSKIGDIKFKLSEAIGIESFAKDRLIMHLRNAPYHNLSEIQTLFRVAFKIDILADEGALEIIQRAITLRHDCVHRNGVSPEGGDAQQINRAMLDELTMALMRLVRAIDESIERFELPLLKGIKRK